MTSKVQAGVDEEGKGAIPDFGTRAMSEKAPNKCTLWRGVILAGILNGLKSVESAVFAAFGSWYQERHYIINGADGRQGILTFEEGHKAEPGCVVGAFYDLHSYAGLSLPQKWDLMERLFRGCPIRNRSLAEDFALPYLKLEIDGEFVPRVTAAVWDMGELISSAVPWSEALIGGASLIDTAAIELDAALPQLKEEYLLSEEQLAFALTLYRRKIADPSRLIELSQLQAQILTSIGHSAEGLERGRKLFREIGILVPLGATR